MIAFENVLRGSLVCMMQRSCQSPTSQSWSVERTGKDFLQNSAARCAIRGYNVVVASSQAADCVLALLRPDELAKLQKYVAAYIEKH